MPLIFSMFMEVIGVNILADKSHQVYKLSKGTLERLLKLVLMLHLLHHSISHGLAAPHGPSYDGLSSSSGPHCAPKKKGILNFKSQGLFACFNVGRHNTEEIRSHKQYVDEQLLKIEARQKELMAKQDILHHRLGLPWIFLHHQNFTTLGRKWEVPP